MEDFNKFRSAKLRVATYDGPLSLAVDCMVWNIT